MKAAWPSAPSVWSDSFLITLTLLLAIGISTSCGSTTPTPPHTPTAPQFGGNTSVTVLLSSTANDQVTQFDLAFHKLALTSQSGKTVTLLSLQQPSEFMHLNGGIERLMTASVPQASILLPRLRSRGQYSCVLRRFQAAFCSGLSDRGSWVKFFGAGLHSAAVAL